jgi:RimJ/RimL family protein N-acetyltransferase
MAYGPFASKDQLAAHVAEQAARHDPMVWAVRQISSGRITGMLSLMDIRPHDAAIELGHIWFAPALRRTRAATEAMALLLRLAADELGYRKLVWRCHALNQPSRRAAERLGFTLEGVLRADRVVKGRSRDTACYAILADRWPDCRDAILTWLDDANFAPDGTALNGLADLRRSA